MIGLAGQIGPIPRVRRVQESKKEKEMLKTMFLARVSVRVFEIFCRRNRVIRDHHGDPHKKKICKD